MLKVEFIESYIRVGNDYQWHDNHGELVRCRDCKWCHAGYCERADILIPNGRQDDDWEEWFCADGERKEEWDASD